MDIPVTYDDVNGTKKFGVVLGDVQTNEKFNYILFSVTKMLLKGYKLKGNKHLIPMWNPAQLIVSDLVIGEKIEHFSVPRSQEIYTNRDGKLSHTSK
jgi:hypothetical protein